MKNKIIYLLFLPLIGLTSCLKEEPKFTLNAQTVFSSAEAAETALMQCYGDLASDALYGQKIHQVTGANGIYWARTDGSAINRAATYDSYPEDDTYLGATWRGFYKVIAESNYYMDGLEKSSLSQEYKARGMAHGRFLRGFSYFMIANLFGKAPIILEPVSTTNLQSPINARNEVYAQAEKDLLFAAQNLPETESMEGIANRNTAIGFVTKLYFILASQASANLSTSDYPEVELWNKTKEFGSKLIGAYSLEPDFAKLWTSHLQGSKEVIFQINFSSATGVFNRSNFIFAPAGYNSNSNSFSTWRMDKGFYDFHVGTHPGDKRIASTYLSTWINQNNGTQQWTYPFVRYVAAGIPQAYNMRDYMEPGSNLTNPIYNFTSASLPNPIKNYWNLTTPGDKNMWPFNKKGADLNANAAYGSRNLPLLRYADVLLMMADAENELNNKSKALEYSNLVLQRAGAGTFSASLPKEQLRDSIFFERMFEMAGEPMLYEDVRRRGIPYLKKVIELHNNSHIIRFRVTLEKDAGQTGFFKEYLINGGNLTEEFLRKNLVLPIPSVEINNNEKITSQDQNFGY